MKTLILLLLSSVCFAQIPRRISTATITEKVVLEITQTSHGFTVGEWLTVDENGAYINGSDTETQEFIGIVSWVSTNTFAYVPPGWTINTLSGLTAGERYYAQNDGTIGLTPTAKPVGIATSTTTLVLLAGNYGTTIPPPSNQAGLPTFSNITSTSATISFNAGNGDGRLVLIGSITELPSNNVFYTANTVFSSGDAIGSAYVVLASDATSVNVTGLTASTSYQCFVFEYSSSGFFITYNTSTGTNGFVTLSSATTPTQSWVTKNKKSKETSIEVTGTRGNGDNIVVVANDSIPVSIDISDGTDPVAAPYGNGTGLGERNFVVYEGSASNFSITGLSPDRLFYFKVYEREDTGNLYNTQAPVDSAYTAWVYQGGAGAFEEGIGSPPGQLYLEANAFIYYDLSDLTFADEANITNGDAGLVDQGPNANTATIVGTPVTNEITFNSANRKAARSTGTNALSTNTDGVGLIDNSSGFEVVMALRLEDGHIAGTHMLTGVQANGYGFYIQTVTTGYIQAQYTSPAGSSTATTGSGILADGVND